MDITFQFSTFATHWGFEYEKTPTGRALEICAYWFHFNVWVNF